MLLVNTQTIKENAAELRMHIQLDSLNGVKDIIESDEFTNDEKVHLIKSQFIIENAEMKQLDHEIKELQTMENFINTHLGNPCVMCDGSCEQETPEGQMTIFDFLGEGPSENPLASLPNGSEARSDVPKELIGTIKVLPIEVLASAVLATLQK